jgi:SAM-dependent methyltransferase
MTSIVEKLDKSLYSQYFNNWDDALFRSRILPHIASESVVLDLGAGAGIVGEINFKGLAKKVCGVDLDPRVVSNPMLDEGKISDVGNIPYENAAFDVVFANNLLEHLGNPPAVFKEVYRVLRPGGIFLFKTPNRWHYVPLIAILTPHSFHEWVNKIRGRAEEDTFPTRYLVNTRKDVTRYANEAGFALEALEQIEGRPEYLRISWPTYLIGAAYERLVNSTEGLAQLRVLLIGHLRKPL